MFRYVRIKGGFTIASISEKDEFALNSLKKISCKEKKHLNSYINM